jgi:hypothetical protein
VEPIGAVVLALGSLSWTIGRSFEIRQLAKPASLAISMQMLTGGTLLLALSIGSGELSHLAAAPSRWRRSTRCSTSSCSIADRLHHAHVAIVGGDANRCGTYAYVNPVVAVLLGVVFAGEHSHRKPCWRCW